jgi:DNA sulfur modification protein DndC
LFDLYKGSNGGECPLVIDTTTPSCGNSRFGCWVCTVVTKDRAIDGLIETGNDWLIPLRDFRNSLYQTTNPARKHEFRGARRRDGSITISIKRNEKDEPAEKHVLGPYRMDYRKTLLKQLLENQKQVQETHPEFDLITLDELEQIRIEWRRDPNDPDWEDSVPKIYKDATGSDAPWKVDDEFMFSSGDAALIASLCEERKMPKQLLMKLLELEVSYDGYARRSSLQRELNDLLSRDWSDNERAVASQTERVRALAAINSEEESLLKRYADLGKVLGDAA